MLSVSACACASLLARSTLITHADRARAPTVAKPSNFENNIPPPYCDNSLCPGGTCCLDDNGKPSCFMGLNDTCCGYDNSACPSGTVCDPIKNDCAHTSNTTVCLACQSIVHAIISKGCTYACNALPPPVDVICDFIVARIDLCDKILNWTTAGVSPVSICSEIGMCSGSTCDCGYCTECKCGNVL